MRRRKTAEPLYTTPSASVPGEAPVLGVGDAILFPHLTISLTLQTDHQLRALDAAITSDRIVALFAQPKPNDAVSPANLYGVGTAATVTRLVRGNDGSVQINLRGLQRIRRTALLQRDPFYLARIEALEEISESTPEIVALERNLRELFRTVVALSPGLPDELVETARRITDPGRLADFVANSLNLTLIQRQEVLETLAVGERLRKVSTLATYEVEILELGQRIQEQMRQSIDRSQREYYLREQLKAIRRELGEGEEREAEVAALRSRLEAAGLSAEARTEADRELDRLARMSPASPEQNVVTTYLDWMAALPWDKTTHDNLDVERASQILDEDHYDLEKVKDRILDYLAVSKLRRDLRGPILAFVGPPGVGKTSLGQSIARSLGRHFVRISLGGIRDEAEIRGHRRTYIGALPGRIIQGMRRAGTNNPVFMLDEIDKLAVSFQGDPAAALLEVLDPAQNNAFTDLYLGVPFDLSKVIFIATGNMTDTIPAALLDRMEVINLAGYTEEDKLQIARRFLVPRQIKENGLTPDNVTFSDEGLRAIIQGYTREAGVRNLEREIGTICRRVARRVASGDQSVVAITDNNVTDFLGAPRFRREMAGQKDEIGVGTGLAWTPTGGDIMPIEVSVLAGPGKLQLTGQLGDVMRESAMAAVTYARSRAAALGIREDFFERNDIHIHVPEGAIPKDGPSAGVTMATALISALTRHPVASDVAMTGEITLRGKVLPVGGLREKILAAHRAGIKTVILPSDNKTDLDDVSGPAKAELNFVLVEHMDQVLSNSLRPEKRMERINVVLSAPEKDGG